jgi:hypothetical protein
MSYEQLILNGAYAGKGKLHPIDEEYFRDCGPQPLFEKIVREHPMLINATTTFYGLLIYSLIRSQLCLNVVEIGTGYGWCSWFMATAVRENMSRLKQKGRYLAVDISDRTKDLFEYLKESEDLPIEYIYKSSLDIKPEEYLMDGAPIDLLYQDGNHQTDFNLKELELIYPILKDNGMGYLVCHDMYSWCEEYRWEVEKLIKSGKYPFEHVSFIYNDGLTIYRNMKNYDHNKVYFPLTDQQRKDGIW